MNNPLSKIRDLVRQRAGNVAVTTALCALPLIGIMGLAVDYSVALATKSKLDAAADAAAIAAITRAQSVIVANAGQDADYKAQGAAQGQAAFKANLGTLSFASVPTPTIQVVRTGQNITANVSYSTTNLNQIGSILGMKSNTISGLSNSSLSLKKYINIYLIVDTSNSMGVGASTSDMTALYNLTGCVFGCHQPSGGAMTNEQIAHQNKINLRIDVIKSAISNMITQAQATAGSNPTVAIGIYSMEMALTKLSAPTANYSVLNTINSNLDLGTNDNDGHSADTYTQNAITNFSGTLSTSGDGSSASSPINYVFVLTDGTYDIACGNGSCLGPYDPNWFTTLKAKATVGIIYTTYYPFYNNNKPSDGLDYWYNLDIAPFATQIAPSLQSCAQSSQWYIQASDGPSIDNALQTLFSQATGSARLTQ